jgi:hypothetical protein
MFSAPLAQPPNMNVRKYIAAAILSLEVIARGATVVVPVSEDTTLSEFNPTFNMGATTLVAGALGLNASGARMRALMRFELAGIPAGATVTSAELKVTIVNVPPAIPPPASTFELHRVLKAWGEGANTLLSGGPAQAGEASWAAPQSPEPFWEGPGASGASDAAAVISSSVPMSALGSYTFPSTPALIEDVQKWIDDPASNFGWMMKSDREEVQQTARRFASKESASGKPTLAITYTVPATELKIQQFELRPAGMFLSWIGGSPPYEVERAETVLGPWTAVTASANETQAIAPADVPTAFYRVVSVMP